MRWKLAALLLMTTCAYGQGVRFDSNIFTSSSSVGDGAQSTMYTVPYAHITVCAYPASGAPCTNRALIYSNQALTQTITQPLVADAHGRFGFWAAPGTYSYSAVDAQEHLLGTWAFTLGGTGGGAATFPGTPGLVYGMSPATARNATAADVVGLFSGCTGTQVLQADGTCGTPGTAINLTTTGTSGPATLSGGTLNVPQYGANSSYFPGTATVTVAGSPSVGQVLTATNATHAAWAAPTGGGSGSGTISGQTVGYVPLATTATASTTSSVIEQTTNSLNIHSTGNTHAIKLPASPTPVAPAAGNAIVASDASGNVVISDNGGTLARPCTATNGLCPGGGSAITLTTTGTSGPATLTGSTLNVPNYATGTSGSVGTGAHFQVATYQQDGTVAGANPPDAIADYPNSAAELIGTYANSGIALNRAMFSDGSGHYYCAGPVYCPNGIYIDDFSLTLSANPSAFDPADVINIIHAFIAARNGHGEFPVSISPSKTSTGYYSGYDAHGAYAAVDGWLGVVWDLYTWCNMPGVTTAACNVEYATDVPLIKTALAYFPKDSTYHLPTVTAGNEWVASTLFMEVMRNTGKVANGSVWYEFALDLLNKLATQAGDSTNATFFSTEKALVDSGIQATLIDSSGMLKTATGQNSTNLDVQTSVLWAYLGYGTSSQRTAIANYIDTNYATLVDSEGYILNSPTTWAFSGCIPSGGGTPYIPVGTAPCYDPSQAAPFYQWGRWSHDFNWFASVLATVNPIQAQAMLESFAHGTNPQAEWHASNSIAPGGTSPNMESPLGAYSFARSHPLVTTPKDTAPATKERFFTQHDWTNHTFSFLHQSGPSAPVTPSLTFNSSIGGSSNVSLFQGGAVNEVVDIQNTNATGYNSISFDSADNSPQGGIGYGNPSVSQSYLRNQFYLFSSHATICFANLTLGKCQMMTNADGSTTINGDLNVTGTINGTAGTGGGGGIAYGTPTITSVYGASLASPNWATNDHVMTVAVTPSSDIPPSSPIFTIVFGKTWTDGAGTNVYPNCSASPRLAPAAGAAVYWDGRFPPTNTTSQAVLITGASQTLPAGATYAWTIQCEGIAEQ